MARLDDGFSTTIDFDLDTGVRFWEKEVTPPGIDGGGEIDTTTMRNDTYRTKWPKSLITLTESPFTAAWDLEAYDEIIAMVNQNQLITITVPDGGTIVFWGWINTFAPNALVEGEQPTAEVEIIASNQNNDKVEVAPDITPA